MSAIDDPKLMGATRLGFADERDVDQFVAMLTSFERGEVDADAWRSFRMLNGVYGQRQENAHMVRAKIPQGVLTPVQLLATAEMADRFAGGKGHLTTRQNLQFHFVKPVDLEPALRLLAAAGLTTREACGNSVRNITTCPFAGTSAVEPFDPTPYAEATTRYLLRGPWSASLPRKFKIAFGGCCGSDCIKGAINDLAFLARRDGDRLGFRMLVGGGTAALPRSAFVAEEFVPVEETLAAAEAVVRVFHRLGDRTNRARARLKYVIERLGREGFLAELRQERDAIRAEGGRPIDLPPARPLPSAPATALDVRPAAPGYLAFARDGVRPQKQAGFATVVVRVPLGDLTGRQLRGLAELTARFSAEGELRTTHDQNVALRFVAAAQAPAVYEALVDLELAAPGAGTVQDVTSCPGASSCKLAVTASRGLAGLLADHLARNPDVAAKARALSIKVSGCPNGCGQHHVAGLGFQGGVRKIEGKAVPQYHLFLGGGVGPEGARFGRLAAKVPARRAPAAVHRLIDLYDVEKQPGETPDAFFSRLPLDRVQTLLADLTTMDARDARPEDFVDLGESRVDSAPAPIGC